MKEKFQVFDCGKPADSKNVPSLKGIKCWENAIFNSFNEAESYALLWLDQYGPGFDVLKVNEPWGYCMGSKIEIRKINKN